ncbi:MAG: hypothetical protein PHE49_10320 [bacterium]|nr:hypothetical protein [bacterium]
MNRKNIFFELFVFAFLISLSGCDRKNPTGDDIAKLYASGVIGRVVGKEAHNTSFYLWEIKDGDSTGLGGALGIVYTEEDTFQLYNHPYKPEYYASFGFSPSFNTTYNIYLCYATLMGEAHIITASATIPDEVNISFPEQYDTIAVGEDIPVSWLQVNGAENIKILWETDYPSYISNESEFLPGNTTSYTIPGNTITEIENYNIQVIAYSNSDTTKPGNIKGAEGYFKGMSGSYIIIIVQ